MEHCGHHFILLYPTGKTWLADILSTKELIPVKYLGQAFGYLIGYVGATLMVALWLFEVGELN